MDASFLQNPFAEYDSLPDTPAESQPFRCPIGFRGKIATFEENIPPSEGLTHDLEFLNTLDLGLCAYGACDVPVYPFISALKTSASVLCAADILDALVAKNVQIDHIRELNVNHLVYRGFRPETPNDEIHNDFEYQYIFPIETRSNRERIGHEDGEHGRLKRYVRDGRLWYVLLHTDPYDYYANDPLCEWVFLFAVGRSPNGDRLVGVVTTQACHNLCD